MDKYKVPQGTIKQENEKISMKCGEIETHVNDLDLLPHYHVALMQDYLKWRWICKQLCKHVNLDIYNEIYQATEPEYEKIDCTNYNKEKND